MDRVDEFKAHSYELLKNNKRQIKCRVWEPKIENPTVVVLEYGYGKNIKDDDVEKLAKYVCKRHKMAVMCVEYGGTSLKYSEDLLIKLEKLLPAFLKNVSQYLKEKYQNMIKEGRYQDVINALYFDRFSNYPVCKDTIIPLYGDEFEYQDYGLTPAIDVLYGIQYVKEMYPNWNWDDCIGFGKGYGAYLIQMAEKLSPSSFSMILNVEGKIDIQRLDLFSNMTEWENGVQKNFFTNSIGRFPIYLVEKFGWTTNQEHKNAFKPCHYDIRNIKNKIHISKKENNRKTPYIFVDIMSEKDFVDTKKDYIDFLIKNDYSLECLVADENEIDGKIVKKNENGIYIDNKNLFDYYMEKYPNRNIYKQKIDFVWYPVNDGAYLIYDLKKYPKINYITLEDYNEIESKFKSNEIKEYLENPIHEVSLEYKELIK